LCVRINTISGRQFPVSSARVSIAAALALCAGLAHAQVTRSWNNPAGGVASSALNWLPIGLPAQQDALVYNLNATYTVLFDPSVPIVRAQTFRRGTVSLQIALTHDTFDEFTVGQLAGDVAEARLTQGQLDTQDLILGLSSGSSGTLRLLGPSNSAAELVRVGIAGAGTLELQPGAQLTSSGALSVGEQSTSVGSALITGATSQLSASALSIGSAGSGTLTIGSGASDTPTVQATGTSSIAPNATGLGLIVLRGGSLELGTLRIARNTSAAGAGTGELEVRAGQADAAVIDIGDDQSGSGILRVTGGRVDVGQLNIFGSPARGQLLLSAGEVLVTGALTVNGALTTTGGRLVLADQSLNLITTNLTLAGGEVSVEQASTLDVSGDVRLTVEGADLSLAGTGTVLNTDELVNENTASAPNLSTIRVESGAQAFVRRLRILSGPGDDGLAVTNASVDATQDVEVVNSALRIGVGGVLRAASVELREGSTSSIDGVLSITGPITLNNSSINSSGPVTGTLLESTATGAVTGLVSTISRFSVGAPLRFSGPQTLRLRPSGASSAMGDQSNPTGVRLACDHVEIVGPGGNPAGTLDLSDADEIELGTTAPASALTIRLVTLRSTLNLTTPLRVFAGSLTFSIR
jgi:T5SS/PEP-CTERM-associated repeat protein